MLFYLDDKTYHQDDLNARWHTLQQQGLGKAKRLAVCTADTFEWLAVALYCRHHNLSVAPLQPDTPYETARAKAQKLDCDYLLWQHGDKLEKIGNSSSPSGTLIQFSSGTTGEPKAIERSWHEIDTEIEHYNRLLNVSADITPVIACAITHSYGFICGLLASMARGVVPHIVTGWNPKQLLRVLESYPKPLLYSSPVFIHTLLMLQRGATPLYGVMTSGSVMPEPWFTQLRAKATHIWQQYGCSEAGCVAIAYQPQTSSTLGRALQHCKLQAGSSAKQAQEIIIEQGDKPIHTRDAGFISADGNLHYCGRLDDTIICGGINVYPQEVEAALSQHPDIDEAVVFKMPDPLAGERVAAIYTGRELSDVELRTFFREHLTSHQCPSWIQHQNQIPRLSNGKISRRQLTQQFARQPQTQPCEGVA
ncbi:AMP-binding protein [Gilvimarinus chinensis]|uniref:AMP-binding protein n=1 Tax=Gilvimarinus chinensis TaxID=396005 RepID=UPI00037F8316|nr:AMP-binding protein [Gilvimarinus chinensis]